MEPIQQSEEFSDSSSELDEPVRKKAKSGVRVRWTTTEVDELKKYFKTYFDSGITPRGPACDKAKEKSKKSGGDIWKRPNHKIIKKISALNHKK